MADKKEYINWFLAEIPLLADKGIIPDETAALLLAEKQNSSIPEKTNCELTDCRNCLFEKYDILFWGSVRKVD